MTPEQVVDADQTRDIVIENQVRQRHLAQIAQVARQAEQARQAQDHLQAPTIDRGGPDLGR